MTHIDGTRLPLEINFKEGPEDLVSVPSQLQQWCGKMSYCHLVAPRCTFIMENGIVAHHHWCLQIYTYCSSLVVADTKAAPNHGNIRLLSRWQNGLIIYDPWLWWMLTADVAAVANALCVGLIMETDLNKTAQQRTAQTGGRQCVSVISFWGGELCEVLMGVALNRCLV